MNRTFLLELGVEEFPAKVVSQSSQALRESIETLLGQEGIGYEHITTLATPRRIGVSIAGMSPRQPDRRMEKLGPAVESAFDSDGHPTKALQGFARGQKVEVAELEKIETPKGIYMGRSWIEPGKATAEVLAAALPGLIQAIPFPKSMRWGNHRLRFCRPLHWIVALLGDEVIPFELEMVAAGRTTRGHRFLAPTPVPLVQADDYLTAMEAAKVMPVELARRQKIAADIALCAQDAGGVLVEDEALLEEVTNLVEWPVPVIGHVDGRFMALPREVLMTSMRSHQKFFVIEGGDGHLLPRFITVANLESDAMAAIQAGNERVLRARLSDGMFFFDQDRKHPLSHRIAGLEGVTFAKGLGSMADKSARVRRLAPLLAPAVDAAFGGACEAAADRAAELAKADLLTEMVGEFPELQGIMGEKYARHDGEPEAVAVALREQYLPTGREDSALPATAAGTVLALADRIDTLVGAFGIGMRPTGSQDPYGLRRAALGVLRIVLAGSLRLNLRKIFAHAIEGFPAGMLTVEPQTLSDDLTAFVAGRLPGLWSHPQDVIAAALAVVDDDPVLVQARVEALSAFRAGEAAASLAAAHKRIHNILAKAVDEPKRLPHEGEQGLEAEEGALLDAVVALGAQIEEAVSGQAWVDALTLTAQFREPVDRFFDTILVMAEEPSVRSRRLGLLAEIHGLFRLVGDIALLDVAAEVA
ncbi:MAG: glycine--tRNA ligase subunit beta [Alphaproteobacteria bacterium CG_4_10_14_0_2_um_filter_63_37]|nr:MAG: glycine--tRNA ligase subunit beta [Proteobacteria bacterium CG1_02_64_396]PJA23910.1 MAG: glycine--tRNA ligase subunit beta [Alphaproteobacteria bacterium CG_4_10_14_0_2_um_filter_63_37]